MKVFFDFEFTGLCQHTTPISLGMIAENGEAFYAEFTDYDRSQVNEWIQENVIANLLYDDVDPEPKFIDVLEHYGTKESTAKLLRQWLDDFDEQVEVWGDCLAYDWVLFCELFGGAFNIPSCVYYVPFDICTLMELKGIDPDVSREQYAQMDSEKLKHNALWDARIIKACYERLVQ
jgi:hypothetical protein